MYKLADGSLSTDYKLGDKFVLVETSEFRVDSVVSLFRDDESCAPLFKLVSGFCDWDNCNGEPGAWEYWSNLKPYKED